MLRTAIAAVATRRYFCAMAEHKIGHRRGSEFFIDLGSGERAFLKYTRESEGIVDLYSTVVPPSHGGRGIGKLLAKEAFEFFAKDGVKMRLTCSFLVDYLNKNPNPAYKKLVLS